MSTSGECVRRDGEGALSMWTKGRHKETVNCGRSAGTVIGCSQCKLCETCGTGGASLRIDQELELRCQDIQCKAVDQEREMAWYVDRRCENELSPFTLTYGSIQYPNVGNCSPGATLPQHTQTQHAPPTSPGKCLVSHDGALQIHPRVRRQAQSLDARCQDANTRR